jgi:hypothetical protein
MRVFTIVTGVAIAAGALLAQDQTEAQASKTRGMPARATPADYQAHGEVGTLKIGAEFFQHTVPTPQGILVTEDFVVVEAGIFGPAGERAVVNPGDFSLRINGKKNPQQSEAYALIFKTLKDPEWEPPEPPAPKGSKSSISTGGKGGGGNDPPPIVHVPLKTQREWNQRVEKEAFPEGDRALPQAGLLFFSYRNKPSSIHQLELIYSGPAGKVSLTLNP